MKLAIVDAIGFEGQGANAERDDAEAFLHIMCIYQTCILY